VTIRQQLVMRPGRNRRLARARAVTAEFGRAVGRVTAAFVPAARRRDRPGRPGRRPAWPPRSAGPPATVTAPAADRRCRPHRRREVQRSGRPRRRRALVPQL